MNFFLNTKIFESGKDWEPADKGEFEGVLGNFIQVLESLVYFPNSTLYYASSEINDFLAHVDLIVGVYEYEHYELAYLRHLIFTLQGVDWLYQKFHRDDHDYILQLDGGYTPYRVSDTTLAEAAEYKDAYDDAAIISVHDSESIIDIYRRNIIPPNHSNLVKLSVLSTRATIIKYFLTNRAIIVFNLNPKHGENRINMIVEDGEPVSPLKCSRKEASFFLTKAIGYKGCKELFFYDSVRDEFLEFKPENTPDNKYHGYYPHNQEEIPEEVRTFLRENLHLFSIDP